MIAKYISVGSLLGALLAVWPGGAARAQHQTNPCATVLVFGTGMSSSGSKLRPSSVDPFFDGVSTTFPNRPNAFVVSRVPATWLTNSASDDSQWIGPAPDPSDSDAGTYIYRLLFNTPCAGARVTGRFAATDRGGIFLNGADTRITTPTVGYTNWTSFVLTGLPAGPNTIEFYVTNAPSFLLPPGPTGLRAELTVVATCCPCLVLDCPVNLMVTNCSVTAGAIVNYTVTGTNRCFTNLFISCTPPSGHSFPPGANTVSCSARDTAGHSTNCSFTVTVLSDRQPPQITCPNDIVRVCSASSGLPVFFEVSATDDMDPNPTVTCVPPSGSVFSVGTTSVSCTAQDDCGRTSKCSFSVVVSTASFVKVLQGGVADGFAGAPEPASPGACLLASGIGGGKPFDDLWPARPLAHTFQGLPNAIVAARLILVMKPTRPASQDDTLRLGLLDCVAPGSWAFTQPIAALPGAGGTWMANPATTFVFDLGALPGGGSLLPHLNAQHRLDLVVGHETAVDYARLELRLCGPAGAFGGLPFTLAGAQLVERADGIAFRPLQTGVPFEVGWDIGWAEGIEWEFDPLPLNCFMISQHHGLTTDWPSGNGTTARLSILPGSPSSQTRISMSQPTNTSGKAIEVWKNGALVSRYFLAGSGDTAVNLPSTACLFTMGFGNGYFFANFKDAVPMTMLTGNHVSGQVGPVVSGDTVKLYFNLYVSAPEPTIPIVKFPGVLLGLAGVRVLHAGDWLEALGDQALTLSDVAISRRLVDVLTGAIGDCIDANPGWNLELNGVADFCDFSTTPPQCNPGHVEVNLYSIGAVKQYAGGLRLTPTTLPTEACQILATVPTAPTINVQITPSGGGTVITVNNVSNILASRWPTTVGGNAGPQSFRVDFPAGTVVTVKGVNYNAARVTFLANPTVLGDYYQVCLESSHLQVVSFKSLSAPPTNPPLPCVTLRCPTGVTVDCANLHGGVATFAVDGVSRCAGGVTVVCMPPSGSVFPPGTTFVHCLGTDSAGNRAECRFPVVVRDVVAPQLSVPGRVIVPCQGPRGAPVDFTVSATDRCDPSVPVECVPRSGTVFAVGTNYVTCNAIDAGGNRVSAEFPIIVTGGCSIGSCIDLQVPDDLTVRCNTPSGARMTYTATARNTCTGGQITPSCDPPSGSVFPVGLTRVVCTARAGSNEGLAGFIVEVTDDTPPELTCPGDLTMPAESPLGAVVRFAVSGRDDCAAQVRIRCSPPSGSVFPVGETKVLCEGADGSGNTATCAFVVTVGEPSPFRIATSSNRVELRWSGDAVVEAADTLGEGAPWRMLTESPQSDGRERVLRLAPLGRTRFFRLQYLPLLPPPDSDRDGVPDALDRCPGTMPGAVVDRYGCSALDFLGAPEGVLDPERGQVGRVVDQLLADGSFAKLVNPLNLQLAPSNHPGLFLRERRLGDATQGQSNWVEELRQTLSEFRRMKPQRVAELLRRATKLDPEHADVRPEDFELERLDAIELGLVESLAESERSLMTLSNLVNAAGVRPTRQRVRLLSLDEARGIALLEGGRTMLLPKPGLPGAPPLQLIRGAFSQGAELDVDVSSLPDGSLFGHTAEPVLQVSSNLVWQLDPRCLRIKVVPANPGLPDFDTGVRHHLRAYKWGFTENLSFHYLEFGMALAVDKINCVLETPDAYKHWVKILVDRDGDGVFSTLVQSLSDTSPPFVLKPSDLPEFRPMPFIVREFRAPMQNGVVNGPSEVVGEETFIIEVNDYAYYGEAFYDRTIFEIRDAPNATGWQAARVTIVGRSFPLTLQAANQQTFRASSYKVSGNSSSYPNVLPIGLNEPFAVRFQDPNETLFFAHPDDVGRGLYGPTLSGFNHGRAFTYRVRLPKLVRDRLYDCAGLPDTYYRIPFLGPMGGGVYGTWRVSQGNNGTFTHNGWQRYAFDFPKPQGLQILAARGGLVDDLRESGSQSCWNPNFDNGDGTTGACVGCSGSKAGNFVKILHQDGTYGVYFHFQVNGVTVTKGQRVYRGDPLGYVGTTGCSTGPHLHFHVVNAAQTETIPIRFEAYDDDFDFRQCLLPASNSEGFSTNEPWWWPF